MLTSVLCSEVSLHRIGHTLRGARYHVKRLACGVVGQDNVQVDEGREETICLLVLPSTP